MAYGPHRHERAPRSTYGERLMLPIYLEYVCSIYGVRAEARQAARDAANICPDKAARCYAAIVRSFE